jgi:hypothetical protein
MHPDGNNRENLEKSVLNFSLDGHFRLGRWPLLFGASTRATCCSCTDVRLEWSLPRNVLAGALCSIELVLKALATFKLPVAQTLQVERSSENSIVTRY